MKLNLFKIKLLLLLIIDLKLLNGYQKIDSESLPGIRLEYETNDDQSNDDTSRHYRLGTENSQEYDSDLDKLIDLNEIASNEVENDTDLSELGFDDVTLDQLIDLIRSHLAQQQEKQKNSLNKRIISSRYIFRHLGRIREGKSLSNSKGNGFGRSVTIGKRYRYSWK